MKTGIFGGTFDPVHNEHLKICEAAQRQYGLERIIVIPSGIPPHKGGLSCTAQERLEMARIAFAGFKNTEISEFETHSDKPNYTYRTLEYLKKQYPDDELYLIIGADSLIDFHTWKNPDKILSDAKLIVCGREGYDITSAEQGKKYFDRALFCSYTGKKLSSSEIRVFLEFGMDCSDMLPQGVLKYIGEKGLYKKYSWYIEKLKAMLSEKRFIHTVYTVIEALKLARITGCDEEKTFIAAALHDCTKKFTTDKLKDDYNFVLSVKVPEPVLHSVSGSYVARTVFNIKDKDILNSIRYHTTGRPAMSMLEKVIYVADCIEQTRDYEGVELLRKKVYEDFNTGFLACMEATIQLLKLKENREEVSDMTIKAYEYYAESNDKK